MPAINDTHDHSYVQPEHNPTNCHLAATCMTIDAVDHYSQHILAVNWCELVTTIGWARVHVCIAVVCLPVCWLLAFFFRFVLFVVCLSSSLFFCCVSFPSSRSSQRLVSTLCEHLVYLKRLRREAVCIAATKDSCFWSGVV